MRLLLPTLALLTACVATPAPEVPEASECSGGLAAVSASEDPSLGQEAPAEPVISVSVRGVRSVPERLVREAIELQPGALLGAEAVRADIRRILQLRVFEDVRVLAESVDGGVAVTYEVVERPLVSAARWVGDGDDAARHRVEGLAGEVFQPGRLARLAKRITLERQREGYAEATTEVHARRSDGGVAVCVRAESGRRWVVDTLVLDGNEAIDDDDLRAVMDTHGGRVNAEGGVYRADLLEDDRMRMLALYYDAGRVMATVGEAEPRWEGDSLVVTIPITEGEEFRVGEVRVTGDLDGPASDYLALVGLEEGALFSRAAITEALARVRERDRERNIDVIPVTAVDEERRLADLEIQVTDHDAVAAPTGTAAEGVGLTDRELSIDPRLAPEEGP